MKKFSSYKRWRQNFNKQMILQITSRTGNQKSFLTFCKMLISAFERKSEFVNFDILTSEQLLILKNQHSVNNNSNSISILKRKKS